MRAKGQEKEGNRPEYWQRKKSRTKHEVVEVKRNGHKEGRRFV